VQIQNKIITPFMARIHAQPTTDTSDKKNTPNQPLPIEVIRFHHSILLFSNHRKSKQRKLLRA
jgi:hypothetical protein